MSEDHDTAAPRTPRWVWGIIVALALVQPAAHFCAAQFPPEGYAPTGLLTVDTASYLTAMQHCLGDRCSPYAACAPTEGRTDPRLFALPHYYLYGLAGLAGRCLHLPPYYALALANAGGLAFLLWAAHRLLRVAVPAQASTAFLLYALGGGAGGLWYLGACVTGANGHPDFAANFYRPFLYELTEGAQFQPWLVASRLYYTLPLALGFWALSELLLAFERDDPMRLVRVLPAVALASFLNVRFAPMLSMVAALWLLLAQAYPARRRLQAFGAVLCGIAPAALLAAAMARSRPELAPALPQGAGASIWFTAFLSAAFFHLWLAPWGIGRAIAPLRGTARAWACALCGYALAFAAGMALYYAYFGNVLRCYDSTAAMAVSPWALLGIPAGLGAGFLRRKAPDAKPDATAWFALWFLLFFCLGICALGEGLLVEMLRNRVKVILGLPLAVLSATAWQAWHNRFPKMARGYLAVFLAAGCSSLFVAWGVTHGPLGLRGLQQQFEWTNNLYLTRNDARMLDALPPGVMLAPSLGAPLLGDVVAQRPGFATVYGNPTLDFSRAPAPEVRATVNAFFSPGAPETQRRALIDSWCVSTVLCPDTCPVSPEVLGELRRLPWLREIAAQGQGAVFAVQTKP